MKQIFAQPVHPDPGSCNSFCRTGFHRKLPEGSIFAEHKKKVLS